MAEIINLPSDLALGFMINVGNAVKPAMRKVGQLAPSECGSARPVRVTILEKSCVPFSTLPFSTSVGGLHQGLES